MKKHILGLALFSFIVSAAAIVYTTLSVSEIIPVSEVLAVSAPQEIPERTTFCQRNGRFKSVRVNQVVLDVQTKQVNWELEKSDIEKPIALHFFSKDSEGTRYITSERVVNTSSRNGILRFSNSYAWLNQRNSYENIYVIAEFASSSKIYSENYPPEFNAMIARAVTVNYGK